MNQCRSLPAVSLTRCLPYPSSPRPLGSLQGLPSSLLSRHCLCQYLQWHLRSWPRAWLLLDASSDTEGAHCRLNPIGLEKWSPAASLVFPRLPRLPHNPEQGCVWEPSGAVDGVLQPCSVMGWGSGAVPLVSVVRSVQKARAPLCCPPEQFTPFFRFLLGLGAPQGIIPPTPTPPPARYPGAVQGHNVATVFRVGGRGAP